MKYFGEDGLITKLERKVDRIIDKYMKVFNQDGSAHYNIFDNYDYIHVNFVERTCGCCPGNDVGDFTITEAMLNHPHIEIGKLFDEKEKKRKEREKTEKAKEVKRKKEAKIERGKQYKRLKKEFENK